ncbi:hypothetical protein J6590_005632 [Homalodisca vitripennis]|nr:hypothetical protein J6590_005632 [Homalodisca vitripennis]
MPALYRSPELGADMWQDVVGGGGACIIAPFVLRLYLCKPSSHSKTDPLPFVGKTIPLGIASDTQELYKSLLELEATILEFASGGKSQYHASLQRRKWKISRGDRGPLQRSSPSFGHGLTPTPL